MASLLIAERDDGIRAALADATSDGFPEATIHLARSVDEVLELAAKLSRPCAAVLHWGMVQERIGECVNQLRAASAGILLTSAWNTSAIVDHLDVDGVLQKPFELSAYLASVQSVLEQRRL
ncbi:MAG: hypothetical protein EHM78_24520 [Myxococcaceae bacterium]|nr:MAG: hypothetical protein EHM78_24520 [Myxococcaceae bacterium]